MKMSKKCSFFTIILKITAGKNTLKYASYSFMQISNLVKLFLTAKSFCKQSKMAWENNTFPDIIICPILFLYCSNVLIYIIEYFSHNITPCTMKQIYKFFDILDPNNKYIQCNLIQKS